MTGDDQHRIFVLRYADRMSQRQHHFYGAIDRPEEPMPISYFVWLITGPHGPILVDTGFTAETGVTLQARLHHVATRLGGRDGRRSRRSADGRTYSSAL